MKNTKKKPILHESFTIINHRRRRRKYCIQPWCTHPIELSCNSPPTAGLSVLCDSYHSDLQLQTEISSSSPPTSENDFKLWENYQTEAKTLPLDLISQFMLLCFASSSLLMAAEGSFASTDFQVFAVKIIIIKINNTEENNMKSCSGSSVYTREKSVPYPAASFCFPPTQWGRKTLIIHYIPLTKSRGKQSQGTRVGFSTLGNAEQKKMRWTVMKRKAEKPPAAATHLTGS